MIKQNVGGVDKWARIVIGVILIIVGYITTSLLWGIIGLIIFLTGFMGRCLLYNLFRFSTCKTCELPTKENDTEK